MHTEVRTPRFLRASLVYFLGNLLSKLALFLLLPLYTARIPAAELGLYDAATAVAVLLSSVLFLDVGVGVMRFYLSRADEGEGSATLSAGLLLMLVSTLLYLLVAIAVCLAFEVAYAPLVVLYGLCNALFAAGGFLARAKGYPVFYAAVGVLSTLLQVAINLILILGLRLGYVALYIAYAVGAGTGAILLLCRCRFWQYIRFTPEAIAAARRLLRFCLPLGISAAAFWVLNSSGRVLVNALLGNAAGGIYAVSLRFAQIVIFVAACFRFAWQEVSFARGYGDVHARDNTRYYTAKIDLFLRMAAAAALLLLPAVRVGLWILPGFIAPAYEEAIRFIPPALLGALLLVLADFLEPIFGTVQKTGYLLLTTAAGAACNVLLTLLFIGIGFGVLGAHLGFCLACLLTVLLRLAFLYRLLGLRLQWGYILTLPAVTFVVVAFYRLSSAWNLAVLCAALLLSGLLLLPEIRLICSKSRRNGLPLV